MEIREGTIVTSLNFEHVAVFSIISSLFAHLSINHEKIIGLANFDSFYYSSH